MTAQEAFQKVMASVTGQIDALTPAKPQRKKKS
jgi:hypothetical protein